MKIVAMSDLHGFYWALINAPEADVLVLAGDITRSGSSSDWSDFVAFLRNYHNKWTHIVIIAGNHDWCLQRNPEISKELLGTIDNAYYLCNESLEIDGKIFFGSPYTPQFFNWAFMKEDADLAQIWSQIPDDVDVLITHGPAKGILDRTLEGIHAGSQSLSERILELKNLKLWIGGHIHEGYGMILVENKLYVNASIMTRRYEPKNYPIIIEICKLEAFQFHK